MMLYISNSEITQFLRCRRKWFFHHYLGGQTTTVERTGPLPMGSRYHTALERYYSLGIDPLDTWDELVRIDRMAIMADGGITDALDSEADMGRAMLEGYLQWLEEQGIDAGWEVLGVEDRLMMQIKPDVTLIGKADLRMRNEDLRLTRVVDHKPQPINEPVLTPRGWRMMGDLVVGDEVMGSNFLPTKVVGVYDKGTQPVVKITLDDGTVVRATPDHPWKVLNRDGTHAIVESRELTEWTRIVPIDPEVSEDVALPLHPYLLGLWLGDGARATSAYGDYWEQPVPRSSPVRVTTADDGVVEHVTKLDVGVKAILRKGRKKGHRSLYTVTFPVGTALDDLGLVERYSYEKFIPKTYMLASYLQRMELLRGLMDADGSFNTRSHATKYHTSSPALAANLVDLVRSVGGYARMLAPIDAYYKKNGIATYTRKSYTVHIRMPNNPFGVSAKALAWNLWNESEVGGVTARGFRNGRDSRLPYNLARRVVSVTDDGEDVCRCIKVDAEDSLYVTTGMTVTHNTAAQFTSFDLTGAMAPQSLMYLMMDAEQREEGDISDGFEFRLARKSKRTARAKGPFYAQYVFRHNETELLNFRKRVSGIVDDMLRVREALDSGVDHRVVSYPTPDGSCTWSCVLKNVCTMFDDGSHINEFLADTFTLGNDPYERYGNIEISE